VTVALEPWNLYCSPVLPSHGGDVSSCGYAIGPFHRAAVASGKAVSGKAASSNFPPKTAAKSKLTDKIFPPGMVVVLAERAPMCGHVPLQYLVSR